MKPSLSTTIRRYAATSWPVPGGTLRIRISWVPGRLGIGEHIDARRVVAGNIDAWPVGRRCGAGALLEGRAFGGRRKVLFHLSLYQVSIEVTHDDDRHQVRSVPAFVEIPKALHRRGFDHLRQADRAPVCVQRGTKYQWEPVVLKAPTRIPDFHATLP